MNTFTKIAVLALSTCAAAPAFSQDRQEINQMALDICLGVSGAMETAVNADLPRHLTERVAEMQMVDAPDFLRPIMSASFDIAYDESVPAKERVVLILDNCLNEVEAIIDARLGVAS